jgi:hypothetical protein
MNSYQGESNMSQHDDPRERLIHKCLDAENTPAEAKELADLLERDDEARVRYRELREVRQICADAVVSGILAPGRAPQDVIRAARQRAHVGTASPGWFQRALTSRFTSGLAAGLLLATLLLTWFDQRRTPPTDLVSRDTLSPNAVDPYPVRPAGPTITVGTGGQQRLDLYEYTDEYGNHWLVEGMREDSVPADANRNDY